MKQLLASILVLLILLPAAQAEPLPKEQQIEILEYLQYVTGRSEEMPEGLAAAAEELETEPRIKCGMSIAAEFVMNRHRFDKELLASQGLQISTRPTLTGDTATHTSPAGLFKIHYTKSGDDAVLPGDLDENSIPDYVESTAIIFDSVYNQIVNVLGYNPAPRDDLYPAAGDSLYDVYLLDLGTGVYGLAYLDSIFIDGPTSLRATSYIILDRDYQNLTEYQDRPLDAVRVTAAHEYFHAVQFGIDFTESDFYEIGQDTMVARYWMEMSSVWMEEELYDDINDFYSYLPFFFNDPRMSLQQFDRFSDLRPYAAGIFPMFLDETFGPGVIKAIWDRCGDGGFGGFGPDFLLATNSAIDSATGGGEDWGTTVREFTLWTWFTGSRANEAPAGVGFEERVAFPNFEDQTFAHIETYPTIQLARENPYNPLHNGATFIRFENTFLLRPDTAFWICEDVLDSTCVDSTEVLDPGLGYDFLRVDSLNRPAYDTTYWNCFDYSDSVCGDSTQVTVNDPWDFTHVRCPLIGDCSVTYWVCDTLVDLRCTDSTRLIDSVGAEWVTVDSVLDITLALGTDTRVPELPGPWGATFIFDFPDIGTPIEFSRFELADNAVSVLGVPNPFQYESVTLALSPATPSNSSNYYRPFPYYIPMDVGYYIDTANVEPVDPNLPAMVMAPYPNPAVVSEMPEELITFRFEAPTNDIGVPPTEVRVVADIYTVAGERVRSLESVESLSTVDNVVEATWDMRNESGNEVASGAYIVYGRLYDSATGGSVLVEDKTKVAIIR